MSPLRKITSITGIVIVIAVSILITIDYLEKTDSPLELQRVLDYCEEKRQAEASNWIRPDGTDWAMITIGLEWHNSTHYIDNGDCEWKEKWSSTCLEPTSEIPHEDAVWNLDSCYWFLDDPYTPYELQRVLDWCNDDSETKLTRGMSWQNETHTFSMPDCTWEEIGMVIEWEKDEEQKRFEDDIPLN